MLIKLRSGTIFFHTAIHCKGGLQIFGQKFPEKNMSRSYAKMCRPCIRRDYILLIMFYTHMLWAGYGKKCVIQLCIDIFLLQWDTHNSSGIFWLNESSHISLK